MDFVLMCTLILTQFGTGSLIIYELTSEHSMLGKNVTQIWGYMAKTIKTIKYTLKIFILAKN